jgi:hypothetical protein
MRWALLLPVLVATAARAEDRATVRGAYYREASTKVVQPMVEVSKDLPLGFDVYAHGLVDAITSPSILTGVMGDNIFTEHRKEAGLAVGKLINLTHVSLSYRQSREPDYVSHSVGVQVQQSVWENTGAVSMALAYSRDTIGPFLDKRLEVGFAGLSYEQAVSPVLRGLVGYELAYLNGFLCNPYDADARGRAVCPKQRVRHVGVLKLARYFPKAATGLQLHYRLYYDQWWEPKADPWGLSAHTVEGRLYFDVTPYLEVRLGYRFHTQGWALFRFCGDPSRVMDPDCLPEILTYHTGDEKFGSLRTHLTELKLTWEARALAGVPVLAWFAPGAFELSYGQYFQTTHYRNAHLLQTGYSLPF